MPVEGIEVKNQPEQRLNNQNAKSARMSSHYPKTRQQLSNALHREFLRVALRG